MSNFYFILIAIFFPALSTLSFILSLLAHIQTERTRKHNTKVLRRLRLDVNNLAKMNNKKLTENEHVENVEQIIAPTPSNSSPLMHHVLSYPQETSLLIHLTSLLQDKFPHLTAPRISAVVVDFGNEIKGWRGSESDSLEGMEEYLLHQLLRTLLNAELDLTFGQMGAILDGIRMKLRELIVGDGGAGHEGGGSEGRRALDVESVDGAGLTQSWSGDTLVGRDEEGDAPILGIRQDEG